MKNANLIKRIQTIQEQLRLNTNTWIIVSVQSPEGHILYSRSALPVRSGLSQRPDAEGAPGKIALSLEEYKSIATERDRLVVFVPPDEE